jgi:hypothetical protein
VSDAADRPPWLVKHLGEHARLLVENEAWREAVRRSEAAIASAMLATRPDDDAGRRDLHAEYRALQRLTASLGATVGDGTQEQAREQRRAGGVRVFGPAN